MRRAVCRKTVVDKPQGKFLHIPYDWRRPTIQRIKRRLWNHDDPRILVPKAFGWGWTVNFYALFRRLHLVGKK